MDRLKYLILGSEPGEFEVDESKIRSLLEEEGFDVYYNDSDSSELRDWARDNNPVVVQSDGGYMGSDFERLQELRRDNPDGNYLIYTDDDIIIQMKAGGTPQSEGIDVLSRDWDRARGCLDTDNLREYIGEVKRG